jgi:hypothetical protein
MYVKFCVFSSKTIEGSNTGPPWYLEDMTKAAETFTCRSFADTNFVFEHLQPQIPVPSLQTIHSMPVPSSPTPCPAYPKAWLTLYPDLALGSTPNTPFFVLSLSFWGFLLTSVGAFFLLSRSFSVLRFWHRLSYKHLHQTWKEQREDEKEMEFKRK